MDIKIFKGAMPIMVTPVDKNGDPDLKSLKNVVEFCLENKACAIGAFGGVSEYEKISDYDRESMLDAIIEQNAGRVPVFAGVTALSVKSTMHNIKQAERGGVDLLMVCSPAIGAMNAADLFDFYKRIADNAELPIILQDTGPSVNTYTQQFIADVFEKLDNVKYAKIEGGKDFLLKINALGKMLPGDRQIIGGSGGNYMLQLLRMGITAVMAGTYFLDIFSHVIELYLSGETEKAVDFYYNTVLPFISISSLRQRRIQKRVLKRRGIIEHDDILFPYDEPELDPFYEKELEWTLEIIEKNIERFK